MSFISPLSLILFIPLAGAIIVLYLLKLKRREQTVSSVFLWQDAVADIQANAPFQKLKKSLLLFLQLAALLMLVTALARPFVRAKGLAENKIVVILDASASMQSTDVSPSRFEQAKKQAAGIVSRMGPGDTMLVITASAKTRVVASFTSDKKTLASAINKLEPADTGCNVRQAMVLALSLVAGRSASPPRVVVLSDGGFGPLTDLSARRAKLDFIKIGRECDNVAITGLDSRKTLAGDQQVFIGLRNYGKRERKFNLEIYLSDQLLDIREQTLGPGQAKQELLKDVSDVGGRVTARLDLADGLASDNIGSVYLTKRRKINVLMVTKGNVFLQNAINLDQRTQLTRTETVPADLAKRKYDLVVFDRVEPPKSLPPGGYLLVNVFPAHGPAEKGAKTSRPEVMDWSKDSPVTAYVDFSSVKIAEAFRLKPKPWAASIIESAGGALAAAGSDGHRSFVQIGFSLLESDFPLHIGFPIFVANCLDYLAPQDTGSAGESVKAGQPVYIDVPARTPEITVTGPDGHKQTVKVTQSPVVYDNTERIGVYQVTGKGISREFACNLSSAEESDTTPRSVMTIGEKRFASTGRSVSTNREFYAWFILIVLGVLSFEWYAYHRRL